jgi:hypothetical protein
MGNSAMEKLANLNNYMQNLNQYLTIQPGRLVSLGAGLDGGKPWPRQLYL